MVRRFVQLLPLVAGLVAGVMPAAASAQDRPARFLSREEIVLYGIGLKVEPPHQTVPKDIATIVSTFLQTPTLPERVSPFAPDAVVKATLRGPSFATPRELTVAPNSPFNIPPLTVPGTHTLENIRLISGGEVLLRGAPEQVTIEVIERLLITQITARPLTAAEIREKGIVFDQSNFQAYNFSAAFAIQDRIVDISFPVLLPTLAGAADVQVGSVALPGVSAPPLPQLKTLIPDTLKLQTQVPNLSVVGFTLKAPQLTGNNFVVPPIPGVIVIPGDIGFLNQYFSVLLMVGNVAPAGSGLVVSNLRAEIVLPPGRDSVVNSADDPLRMANTNQGESPRVQLVVQPGPDGKLGTADDLGMLTPGDSGNAEFLVEGRREGSHVVEMEISGTLEGLPVGPVDIRGRAAGSVLVRNPKFTLTFTHPEAVSAGEAYTLDVTVTNTSESPANFVQMTLYPRNVSGATVIGEPSRAIESIAPGDSGTVSFDLVSRITGTVTAATLDSDDKVAGRFELKAAVGELGVPISPDTLVLPKEAGSLPRDFRDAALGLLGKAYAVATAPPAALPRDLRRFSRKIVIDRAVEVAEAGFRYTLREPLPDSAAQLFMDFVGSNFSRLGQLVKPEDLDFERDNFLGFDELRRRSVRGDVFATAVGAQLSTALATEGAGQFHYGLAQKWSYRPGHISVLVSAPGEAPVSLSIVDAAGTKLGGVDASGKIIKDIPFSDLLPFSDSTGAHFGELALMAAPASGAYTVRLTERSVAQVAYSLSVVMPRADGTLHQVVYNVAPGQVPQPIGAPGDPFTLAFELVQGTTPVAGAPVASSMGRVIADPAPSVISVIQQKDADQLRCEAALPGYPVGRVVAVLFSEEVTPASVHDRLKAEDITGFRPENNRVVGVALQPGRRIAFVALRDPVGPFVPRQIAIDSAVDLRGQTMAPFTGLMETTVSTEAGVVSGRVVRADGTPVPFANVRLFYLLDCGIEPTWVGISSKSADAEGRFSWDYVLRSLTDRIVAVDPETDEFRSVPFNIQRDGQRLNVDIVFLGRGTFSGTTRSEAGVPLKDTAIRVSSLTDGSQYGAKTDANGRFSIARIPVGNIFVEAINTTVKAKFAFSEAIPFAGAAIDRDITLLDIEQQEVVVKHGTVKGHVLRASGTPAGNVPVYVWYANLSQPNVRCPGTPTPPECAVAGGYTDAQGAFSFADVVAGSLRVSAFDQDGLVQGEARLQLAENATVDLNVFLVGGLGTVTGRVLSPDGAPVAGASVGGGLSLVTTNTNGEFTLTDVPVGRREIIAVSDTLKSSGRATIDLTRAGDTVSATIVLDATGSVAGTVVQSDNVTPVSGGAVYVFQSGAGGGFEIVGTATTNALGAYRIDGIRKGSYQVSSFNASFTDGNIVPAVVNVNGQVFRADIKWRGGNGRVTGRVLDDDGQTPLKAMVSISGDRIQVAGGRVGVAFQYVNHYKIAETDFTTGTYAFAGALVGPVTISAAGQFSPDPIAVNATIPSADATIVVDLKLQPTSQIRGTIFQSNGSTPAGAGVIVTFKSEAFRVICTTSSVTGEESCDSIPQGIQEEIVVTDENGRFWLPIVNAGPFSISAEDPVTGKIGQIKGSVRAGDEADVSVRLLGLGELSVQVFGSDTTTPIPGAKVVVQQLNFPKKEVEGRADTTGSIVFVGADGFSEGEFAIEATDLRNGFAGRGTARISSDGEQVSVKVYLFDAAGAVSGRIFASNGLTPVPNAEIVLSNNAGPIAFALSQVDGSYRIEMVPLGDFRVEAFEAKTARRAAASGRIDLANQEVPLNLTQGALGIVKGHVLDNTTLAPLKGWNITLGQRSSSGLSLGSLQTTSAVDGSYMFPGTGRGTFTLTARHSEINGSAGASGTIDQEGELVDVPLLVKIVRPLSGTISGTVLTASGEPAPNSPVEICHPSRSCENPIQLTADPAGNFSLPDVPLGRFRVTARSQLTREAGSIAGELSFDGDIASVRVVLSGVSEVRGRVERSNGSAAQGVRVTLMGLPDPGCALSCTVFTDADGRFAFMDVPARTFTVTAVDPLNTLQKGAAGGSLNPGQVTDLRIVLAPAFALTGRVVGPGSVAVAGAVAELVIDADRRIFAEAGADGIFTFAAAPPGTYQLLISDPLGPGIASRSVSLSADVALGDILLDVAAPVVLTSDPASAATGVPQNQVVRVTFSEPIRPVTVTAENISLSGPDGPLTAQIDAIESDTVVRLTLLAPLAAETRYTLRVKNVQDRFGKVMAADYVAAFTTVDITRPAVVDASPAAATGGAPIYSPIRIKFSETVDVTKFTGAPLVLTGPASVIAGRTDYLFGNSVIVFTPNLPLAEDTAYSVAVQIAFDLAGNQQASALAYQFTTTDRTAPQIASVTAANNGNVVENGIASVLANVGTTHDIAAVDWYINDVLSFADRTAPFEVSFAASTALYGPAGSTIHVAAVATDTSGNRGDERSTDITITPDQAPAVTILAPANGLAAHNGDRIVVRVRATDDLGNTQIGYRAQTGNPADAITRPFSPAVTDRTEEFVFFVPQAAAPGTTITVHASASDTKAQVAQASIDITVLDALPPTVTITGATSGARVFPGQQTTVVVTAQDLGRIASVRFNASGLVTATETRQVDPAQPSIVTSFTVTVPTTARPGQTLILGATAFDVAGNSANAAQVVLPVADTNPPTITLAPQSGSFDAVPGRTVHVVATAEDEVGLTRIDMNAAGAVTFSESKQVSPPTGSAEKVFAIPVPDTAQPGTQIVVTATATDLTSNTSAPATLVLNVISPVNVTLPPSAIVDAGEAVEVSVQISDAAPAGGLRLDFAADDPTVASPMPFVVMAEGQTSATFTISGVSGGTTQIRALAGGVLRASMTATVRGGIVSGFVRDVRLDPVAGAQLTISSGNGPAQDVVTDSQGRYVIDGVAGPDVSVRALDPVTRLYGHATGTMAHRLGYATIDVVLIPAASIHGTVFDSTGAAVGAGVRVDIFAGNAAEPLAATFTIEDGSYEFPLVTLGEYRLEAASGDGRRGRSTILLGETGQDAAVNIVYLGAGTVTGTVRLGANPVPNAQLTFRSWSIFGSEQEIVASAQADGTFSFPDVKIGSFSIVARDEATGQAGTASGSVAQHQQSVLANIQLTSYGTIEGRVFRHGGTTVVVGAEVALGFGQRTITDADGRYRFDVVPLGSYSLTAEEAGTRSYASGTVNLTTQGSTATVNLSFQPQGRLLVSVADAGGLAVAGAFVSVQSRLDGRTQGYSERTQADGTVLIDHVLAGAYTINASYGAQHGSATGSLIADELKPVSIELSPTGSLAGIVYEADGQTPAAGARVAIAPFGSPSTVTGADGSFRFDGRPLGSYDLLIYDAGNRLRARTMPDAADDLVIESNGQVVTRDFTFIGLGTVTGRIINPDGSSAQNMTVQIWYAAAGFQASASKRTDAGGFYTFEHVPAGGVSVVASDLARQLYGERLGIVERHGETVSIDIALTSNAITLPRTLRDANQMTHDVQRSGVLANGQSVFYGNSADQYGAMWLDITSGGATTRFGGPEIPTIEDGGREIAVRQENVAGLSVTRKVFVPRTGYFARYLEIFRNPTAAPIDIDIDLTSYPTGAGTRLAATSSGDNALTTADNWLVTTRTGDNMSVALLFQGADATLRAAAASFELRAASFREWALARYGWQQIRIEPGETVAFMHFGVQQLSLPAATASAARLAPLSPEALSGLSLEEIAAIRNFVMPAGGVSTVAPLPALTGQVTGRALEYDGTTTVPNAHVQFTSGLAFFPRTHGVNTNAEGVFTFTGDVSDDGYTIAIPAAGFTLQATHRDSGALSPIVSGMIESASVPAVKDVVFANLSMVTGLVRRHTGSAVPGGNVFLTGGPLSFNMSAAIGSDSAYRLAGVPAGTFQISAHVPHAQGSALSIAQPLIVPAGQAVNAPLTLPPTGNVTGTVRSAGGVPVAGVAVTLQQGPSFIRSTTTGSGGAYTLTDVPQGAATLTATEPRTDLKTTASTAVVADTSTTVDLVLTAIASVRVQVSLSNSQPAVGSSVLVEYAGPFGAAYRSGNTDALGFVTLDGVPEGTFTVTAGHPGNSQLTVSAQGAVTEDATVVPMSLMLPPAGSVTVSVARGSNPTVASSLVQLTQAGRSTLSRSTDSTGTVTFTGVGGGAFTVTAHHPANFNLTGSATGSLSSEGESVTAAIMLPPIGTVTGTVRLGTQTIAGVTVSLRSSSGAISTVTATTDASGVYTIAGVPGGGFSVTVEDFTRHVYGVGSGQITTDLQTLTVNIALVDNLVQLGMDLFDGNNFRWDIERTGRIGDGSNDAYDGGLNLVLMSGTTQASFNGASSGIVEEAGREVAIRQAAAIFGLDVTRKIYVPADGYFARFLEVLSNPTTSPITVDVAVRSNYGSDSSTNLVATSSGDTTFDLGDLWLVTDDNDGSGDPSLAHVIGGAGASRLVSSASRSGDNVEYRWNSITVPPGQTVMLMHFAAQHVTRAQVRVAGERLVQLPPEAMTGLSAEEIAAISNFAVPADGSSPLPEVRKPGVGTVTGRVFAVDGATPLPSVRVESASSNVLFDRRATANTDAQGRFTLTNVPTAPFTVRAFSAATSLYSPEFPGAFDPGHVTAAADVTFSNAGMIRGSIRTATGELFAVAGTITVPYFIPYSGGQFTIPVVAPGARTVVASINLPQGSFVTASGTAQVLESEVTTFDLPLPPLGRVTGTVRSAAGVPVANARVMLHDQFYFAQETTTGPAGEYTFTHVPVSSWIRIGAVHPRTDVPVYALTAVAADQTHVVDLTLEGAGSLSGIISNPDGSTTAGINVEVRDSTFNFLRFTTTSAAGEYAFADVPTGTLTLRAYPEGFRGTVYRETELAGPAEGAAVTANVTMPAVATIRVLTLDASGNPQAGNGVYYRPTYSNFENYYGSTNAEGYLDLMAPEGSYYSVATYPYPPGEKVLQTGQIVPADHGRLIVHTFRARTQGSVSGIVYSGDGQTRIPYPFAQILEGAVQAGFAYGNAQGEYSTGVTWLPSGPFTIKAFAGDVSATSTASVAADGTAIVRDFTLPVAVIRGTVTFSDGSPVPYPDVFATTTIDGSEETYYSVLSEENGAYFIVVPAGIYTVMARSDSGLTVTASATLADVTSTATLDLQMPPTGSVTGEFRNAAGQLIPWADVRLASPGLDGTVNSSTEGDGRYRIDGIPLGPFTVEACHWDPVSYCETVTGELTASGQVVTANIKLAGLGSLSVRVVDPQGAPAEWAYAMVEGITRYVDGNWEYGNPAIFSALPDGTVFVTAEGPDGLIGTAEATIYAGRRTEIELRLGNAVWLDAELTGADNFRYDVRCDGSVRDGGTVDGSWYDAFDGTSQLRVGDGYFPCRRAAVVEEGGRELVIGPAIPADSFYDFKPLVLATRKVFSPASGGFVRYYEQFTNTAAFAQTFTVELSGNYGPPDASVVLDVAPSQTSNTYGVMTALDSTTTPAIALVFAGAGAPSAPVVQMTSGLDEYAYRWNITLAPGASAALLHFAVQRAPGAAADAQAQADALAGLTDPAALAGLSAEEQALIVNFAGFTAPTELRGTFEGSVVGGDGVTPIAGANVYAIDIASGRFLRGVVTGASGTFRFENLLLTSAGIRLVATEGVDADHTVNQVVTIATTGDVVSGIVLQLPITVLGGIVQRASTGEPVANPVVFAARADGSADTFRGASTPNGRYGFMGLPGGVYNVTAMDAAMTTSVAGVVTMPSSGSAMLDLVLPDVAACAPLPAAAASWLRAEGDASNSVHSGPQALATGAVAYVPSKVGQGFSFNGEAGIVQLPVGTATDDAFSIETWFTPRASGDQYVLTRIVPGVYFDLLLKQVVYGGAEDRLLFQLALSGGEVSLYSLEPLEIGRAYHVAMTYDGMRARLYVNGQLQAAGDTSGVRASIGEPLNIGSPLPGDPACDCVVDELKLLDRAMSAADVQASFAAAGTGACTDLTLLTTAVPVAVEGQPYATTLRSAGGLAPVTYAVTSGAPVPGVTLSAGGVLSGTPTATGSHTFTVTVTDAAGATATATLVQECGTCLAAPAGAIAFWNGDGNALDPVGGHHGTLSGVEYGLGINGRGFLYSGADTLGSSTARFEVADNFTIEFWARPSATHQITPEANEGISGLGSQRYAIAPEYRATHGEANVAVSVGTNGISVFEHGPSYLPSLLVHNAPITAWTHVAVVYRDRRPFLYVNGVLAREGLTSTRTVYLSKQMGDWGGYGYYQGLMDEIGMYNRPLTDAEIAAIVSAPIKQRCQ